MADYKQKISAGSFSLAALLLMAASAPVAALDREEIEWTGECIKFQTPTAGVVPCDRARTTFDTNSGEYSFSYVDAQYYNRVIAFYGNSGRTPAVESNFRVTGVQDDRDRGLHPPYYGPLGNCDTRDNFVTCLVTGDLGKYIIVYRMISKSRHLICPPPPDIPHKVGDACAITYDAATAKRLRPRDRDESDIWKADCVSFQTSAAGKVPCIYAATEVWIRSDYNDGSAWFSFRYDTHDDKNIEAEGILIHN